MKFALKYALAFLLLFQAAPDTVKVHVAGNKVVVMTFEQAVCTMTTTSDMALRQNIIHALGLPGNPVKGCDKVRCKE